MRALIGRTPALNGSPLFLFAVQEAFTQSDALDSIWTAVNGKLSALI
jgi:hypothetical protein